MLVDISHVADKTFYDAIETSKARSSLAFVARALVIPPQHDRTRCCRRWPKTAAWPWELLPVFPTRYEHRRRASA